MTGVGYEQMDAKRGLDYIGATVVFFCHDGEGNLLMHKRSARCRDEQGRWDCGAGSMEFGESFEEAVRREVKEEYLVDPEEVTFVCANNVIRKHEEKTTHWIALLHVVRVDRESVGVGEPEKMDGLAWFSVEDLPEPLHSMLEPHLEMVRTHL